MEDRKDKVPTSCLHGDHDPEFAVKTDNGFTVVIPEPYHPNIFSTFFFKIRCKNCGVELKPVFKAV